MSKAGLAAAGTGVGRVGAIAGGIYLSGTLSSLDSQLPDSVDKLKSWEAKGCVAHLFPNLSLDSSKQGTAISDSPKIETKYFEGGNTGSACLTVNWERDNFSDKPNSWRGNFRWLWSFVKGDKGLVMFTVASPSETEKQMDLTGIFYLIKKDDKGVWTIDKYKDINTGKKVDTGEFDKVFPKAGDVIKSTLGKLENPDQWGFVSGKDEMNNVCKKNDDTTCKTKSQTSSLRGLWLVNSFEGEKSVKEWSSNIDTLLDTLYTTTDLSIKDVVNNLKGKWTLNSSLIHKVEAQAAEETKKP